MGRSFRRLKTREDDELFFIYFLISYLEFRGHKPNRWTFFSDKKEDLMETMKT